MAGFSPTRLQIARARSGLFRKELASRCGVTAQTISNWEAGHLQPSPDNVAKLAEETGFLQEFFFLSEVDPLEDGAVTFRARTRIPARQKHSALAAASMARELAQWIEKRFELPPVRLGDGLPDLRNQPPDLVARVVRSEWLLGDRPLPNVIHLLESRGVMVLSLAQDVHELDAFSFWSGERPVVLLNTMKTAERSRYDAAHELMHLLCHRERTDKHEEEEANRFAGAFLMPEADIRKRLPHISGLGRLMTEKRRWGVSLTALAYRLHELGIASEWQYRMLFVELSKRGYRAKEPNRLPRRETSKIMSLVFDGLERQGIKPSGVARDLGWHRPQLDELIFGLGATMLPVQGGRSAAKSTHKRQRDHLQLVEKKGRG